MLVVLLGPLATDVLAQAEAPPQPSLRRYPGAWIGYLIIIVLLAAVIAVSLMPSKRGHQD